MLINMRFFVEQPCNLLCVSAHDLLIVFVSSVCFYDEIRRSLFRYASILRTMVKLRNKHYQEVQSKTPAVNTLRSAVTTFLTPKKYDEHPVPFIWDPPPWGYVDVALRINQREKNTLLFGCCSAAVRLLFGCYPAVIRVSTR